MEIEKVMIPIEKIINNSEECFAHVAKDNKQKETLKEHTERCQKYWKNLVEKKNLTEILEEFEKCYFNSTDEKVKEIFESMTVNIVTMHDIGKVNPEFQKEKMDHLWHRDVPLNDKVGSKHSIISSVFYLDYYIGIINLAVKNETIYKSDKDISRLDSEEQFMGRINRSGKKEGVVYFFNMDDASVIYKNDVRIEKDKTLENEEIRQLLLLKNFPEFYETRILPSIKKEGEKINDKNLEEFFCDKVALLNMPEVAKRMRLIDDNRQMISVYLGRILQNEKGEKIDGRVLWQEYKGLIEECKLEYAEKKIKLHDIRSQMNGFIYQFSNQIKLQEDEQIGDIFFIENGERYFDENGVLMKELFEDNTDLFI